MSFVFAGREVLRQKDNRVFQPTHSDSLPDSYTGIIVLFFFFLHFPILPELPGEGIPLLRIIRSKRVYPHPSENVRRFQLTIERLELFKSDINFRFFITSRIHIGETIGIPSENISFRYEDERVTVSF